MSDQFVDVDSFGRFDH